MTSPNNNSGMDGCVTTPQQLKGGCKNSIRLNESPLVHFQSTVKSQSYLNKAIENGSSKSTVCFSNNENRLPSRSETILNRQCPAGAKYVKAASINTDGIWRMAEVTDGGQFDPNKLKTYSNNNKKLKTPPPQKVITSSPSTSTYGSNLKFDSMLNNSRSCLSIPTSVTVTPISAEIISPLKSSGLSMRRLFTAEKPKVSRIDIDSYELTISPPVPRIKRRTRTPLRPLGKVACKSSLLHDVSPLKIEKAYGQSSPSEKENFPVDIVEEKPIPAHLLGFPNLGNTCYLNAVLQSLVAVRVFRCDVSRCVARTAPSSSSLLHALSQLLHARKTGLQQLLRQPLRLLKENFEAMDQSFIGWKMQDANEFLTKVLDTVKDEVDKLQLESQKHTDNNPLTVENKTLKSILDTSFKSGIPKLLNNSVLIRSITHNGANDGSSISPTPPNSCNKRKRLYSGSHNRADDRSGSSKRRYSDQLAGANEQPRNPNNNPIAENFGFQLKEVYECLSCNACVTRGQDYYSLYVHLASSCLENEEETLGPGSLRAAVAQYMKQELRELTCDKCGHDKALVTTHFTRMPRILIIQVKRYKFNAEEYSSLKVSSTIEVNKNIDLSAHCHEDTISYTPVRGDQNCSAPPTPCKATPLKNRNREPEPPSTPKLEPIDDPAEGAEEPKLTEEEQIEEAVRRSLNDSLCASPERGGVEMEEDDLQKAIRLSLEEANKLQEQQQAAAAQTESSVEESCEATCSSDDDEPVPAGPHVYQLASIVCHFGQNTTTGHYTCDVLSEGRDWLHYDDDCVSQISQATVFGDTRRRNGYIFFYIHKDILTGT